MQKEELAPWQGHDKLRSYARIDANGLRHLAAAALEDDLVVTRRQVANGHRGRPAAVGFLRPRPHGCR